MLHEMLLPRTDAGVVAQVVLVLVLGAVSAWLTRGSRPTSWPLVGGVTLVVLGLMGLRAAH